MIFLFYILYFISTTSSSTAQPFLPAPTSMNLWLVAGMMMATCTKTTSTLLHHEDRWLYSLKRSLTSITSARSFQISIAWHSLHSQSSSASPMYRARGILWRWTGARSWSFILSRSGLNCFLIRRRRWSVDMSAATWAGRWWCRGWGRSWWRQFPAAAARERKRLSEK